MKTEYDRKHDAAYFELSALDVVRQVKLDDVRIVDYAADGSVVGVEFISPSRGVNLEDVPHAAEIRREARRLGFPLGSSDAAGRDPGRRGVPT